MRVRQLRSLHYAWIVAGVVFITLLGAAGFRSTPGVLIVPLQDEFGWSRATISFAISINLLLYGLMSPFAASLMSRFGVRRVAITALLIISSGIMLTTVMTAAWQLVLIWGVIVGLGTGSMTSVLGATVVSRWFVERRATVLGVLTAAGATGQLAFLPLLAWITDRYDWRFVSVVVAISALSVVPLIFIFMREYPADMGLTRYGETVGVAGSPPPRGPSPIKATINTLRTASTNVDFMLLAGTFFICGASTNGLIGTHLIPAAVDHGMTEVRAASLLALVGIFDVIGTTLSGWLTDRWDARKLLFAYYGLRGLSLMFLTTALERQNAGLILFIVFYGLDWVATVPPTVTLTTKAFGNTTGPVVYGWIFAAHQIGAASAAFAAGAIRSSFGDYFAAFVIAGALCLAAAAMSLRIGRTSSGGAPGELVSAPAD
jgi:predicted MFS family arabinose efflux permease